MYDPRAYNSLPSLRQAAERLDGHATKHLFGEIRQVFLDNNAHEKYGISVLHKHFPIGEEDRLVDCRHTPTAWKVLPFLDSARSQFAVCIGGITLFRLTEEEMFVARVEKFGECRISSLLYFEVQVPFRFLSSSFRFFSSSFCFLKTLAYFM
ncbi:hypothetical protein TSTA_066430 [Talaromyces stipitatus ATCC 10500]|uniref:Uncharacterized protein n=1 Tax=Talaromyces stipitatus (strain ATCC 10500 / CBS 375.48 / QM 6759 / NRRL 1006) TaxID=441959 RepID=B8LXB5_TALSN|nr:uncharacterized protein TSTA_066430 [Talaromyces stipitatus ATCC 10500]EED23196.1 hypothetical protein TSTA_066430 [Talaromyces stipitatus ATCC 10500]